MSEKPISHLRHRMLEDMTVRRFSDETQREYIRQIEKLRGLPRPLPRYRDGRGYAPLPAALTETGAQPPSINAQPSALRFFFTITLDRPSSPAISRSSTSRASCRACSRPEEVLACSRRHPAPQVQGRAQRCLWRGSARRARSSC